MNPRTSLDPGRLAFLVIVLVGALAGWLLEAVRVHGQVVNDKRAAAANTIWAQGYLDRGEPLPAPTGVLYLYGPLRTPATVGCGRVTTTAAGGYCLPEYPYHPTLSGKQAVICQLKPNSPVFILSGAGFICTDPLSVWLDGSAAAVEVEGRKSPHTGRHRFANFIVFNAQAAFKALAGYYESDEGKYRFVPDENGADNCQIQCETFNCPKMIWLQNQQAVNWRCYDCVANWIGPAQPFIAADIERGGLLDLSIAFCTPEVTLFRLRDYSPNNAWLRCRYEFDRMPGPQTKLTPIDFVGDPTKAKPDYCIDIEGFAAMKLRIKNNVPPETQMPQTRWHINHQTIYTN